VVDDAAEAKVLLREADLQHHLSVEDDKRTPGTPSKGAKPTEKIIAGPASGKTGTAAVKTAKADTKDEAKKDPAAKKEDLQLAAALAHLKAPAPPATTAAAAAAVAK
jgi:hypothetical protein